jgi:hypothetical protein
MIIITILISWLEAILGVYDLMPVKDMESQCLHPTMRLYSYKSALCFASCCVFNNHVN